MFTGIIEDLGIVKSLARTGSGARLSVESKICAPGTRAGDSINTNGACLTVVDIKEDVLSFDISSETLNKTNLGRLKQGECVNIERSLKADSRLSGHFVFGHIDCIGEIVSKEPQGEFVKIKINISQSFAGYLVEKGSVCVDGISLTINTLGDKSFTVMLIPHTLSVTTLGIKQTGDYVNVELDILAKYVERLAHKSARETTSQPTNITKDFLKEHGFI